MSPSAQCNICNRVIEDHLQRQKKELCFTCLTEDVTESGAVSVFNLKERPVQAPCALCDVDSTGHHLKPSPWGFICTNCATLCTSQSGVSWDLITIMAQKEWLVKANRRILGPYSKEEVSTGLKENRFVPLDEISKPYGRWVMIRDEDTFRPVVNEIKNKRMQQRENTASETASGTYSPEAQTSSLEFIVDESEGLKEASTPRPENNPSRDLLKSYAAPADPRVQRQLKKESGNRVWIAFCLFFLIGLGGVFYVTGGKLGSREMGRNSFPAIMQKGLEAERVGNYVEALKYYNDARNIDASNPELLIHLAPLTLVYDHQTLQSQRMFEEVLHAEGGVNYQKASFLGLGLIALDSHDWDLARDHFTKALKLDPLFLPAVFNQGVVAFFKDDLVVAENLIYQSLEKGGADGAVVLTMAEVNMAQAGLRRGAGRKKLLATHEMLDAFMNLSQDYNQEALIVDARVLTMLGRKGQAEKKINRLLDNDPEVVDLHIRDWQIYRGRASWGLLIDSLKKTADELPNTPQIQAALGLAMYRGREKLDGDTRIQRALSQDPRDPVLMSLAGWVDLKLGRREAGVLKIKEAALIAKRERLPFILRARLCWDEKDFKCVRENWEKVLNRNPRSVEAMHGLAQLDWEMKNAEGANRWIVQAQAMDPTYIPVLELAQKMGREAKK